MKKKKVEKRPAKGKNKPVGSDLRNRVRNLFKKLIKRNTLFKQKDALTKQFFALENKRLFSAHEKNESGYRKAAKPVIKALKLLPDFKYVSQALEKQTLAKKDAGPKKIMAFVKRRDDFKNLDKKLRAKRLKKQKLKKKAKLDD